MTTHLEGGKEQVFRELAVHIGQGLDRYCDDDDVDDVEMDLTEPAEEHKEPEPAPDSSDSDTDKTSVLSYGS